MLCSINGLFFRSLSVTDTTKAPQDSQDVPALLKHIMSSGSMVEDIERQQRGEAPPTPSNALSSSMPNDGVLKLLTKPKSGDQSQTYQRDSDSSLTKEPKWFLSESSAQPELKGQDLTDKLGDSLSKNRLSDSAIRGASPSDNFSARRQSQSSIGRVGSAELLTPAALEKSVSSEKVNHCLCK